MPVRVRANYVHHNGALGLVGTGVNMLFENDNRLQQHRRSQPVLVGGRRKWVATSGLVVRGNFAHHNKGHGLWTDIENIDTLYQFNRSEDNDLNGIFHEVSYRAVIRYNTCQRNGVVSPTPGWVTGAGISVNSSPDVEVYENIIVNNFNGIGGIQTPRGSGKYRPVPAAELQCPPQHRDDDGGAHGHRPIREPVQRVHESEQDRHVNGAAIFPANFARLVPAVKNLREAFDVALQHHINPIRHNANKNNATPPKPAFFYRLFQT